MKAVAQYFGTDRFESNISYRLRLSELFLRAANKSA